MWWQPSECPEDLATANWTAAFISLIELQFLWLGWSQSAEINWHLTVAKRAVPSGLSPRLCCNKRAVRVCVAGCFNCNKGNPSLVAVTLHSHITVSPVTCHLSVKHWARELVWPSRDRRGYTSYWRTIPCCTCILAEYGLPSLKLDSIRLVQRYPISWSFMIPFLWNTKYI